MEEQERRKGKQRMRRKRNQGSRKQHIPDKPAETEHNPQQWQTTSERGKHDSEGLCLLKDICFAQAFENDAGGREEMELQSNLVSGGRVAISWRMGIDTAGRLDEAPVRPGVQASQAISPPDASVDIQASQAISPPDTSVVEPEPFVEPDIGGTVLELQLGKPTNAMHTATRLDLHWTACSVFCVCVGIFCFSDMYHFWIQSCGVVGGSGVLSQLAGGRQRGLSTTGAKQLNAIASRRPGDQGLHQDQRGEGQCEMLSRIVILPLVLR